MNLLPVHIHGHDLFLGDRFVWAGGDLLLADLHLGKTAHFRKAGMAIPAQARKKDQSTFYRLLQTLNPTRVIVLGDLFHSQHNSEVEEWMSITSQFQETQFCLVRGNHDVLESSAYRSLDFETTELMNWHAFVLSHEPLGSVPEGAVNVHGHLHPGIGLSGKGRQNITIPCFHVHGAHFCLPAFGALTGLVKINPKRGDRVYGIANGEVVPLLE
jgi:DNA ligase-associated metallophosphoesterase